MVLVSYSDSESESEPQPLQPSSKTVKPANSKLVDRAEPGKIKIHVPSIKPEPAQNAYSEPPAKKARVGGGGAFSGFNSLLPAPKRIAQNAPNSGISLKTSSEAAFSREQPAPPAITEAARESETNNSSLVQPVGGNIAVQSEPKLVGNPMKFLPLSVANKKKKPAKKPPTILEKNEQNSTNGKSDVKPMPKRSLFSLQSEDEIPPVVSTREDQSEDETIVTESPSLPWSQENIAARPSETLNSIESISSGMNLTAAQRRQLFGRNGKDVNITHFNTDSEYAANEELRQAGELMQHRAVKAVAPGKHSLQQLVNNAKTQKDAMEDAWAEGKRNRGEGGSKYGWR